MLRGFRPGHPGGARLAGDAGAAERGARRTRSAIRPPGRDVSEDLAFLDWLADNHFTFLGARDYRLEPEGDGRAGTAGRYRAGRSGRCAASGVLRKATEPRDLDAGRAGLPRPARAPDHHQIQQPQPGASPRAYGLCRRQDVRRGGQLTGEQRFVGLFTSGAYSLSPRQIPLLRRKIAAVTARAGLAARQP